MPLTNLCHYSDNTGSQQYYSWLRRDILEFVPPDAGCVLSVGCGAGVTEAELVKKGIKVVGIEINHEAAIIARQHGIRVLEGDASQIDVSTAGNAFDCLIYADILEHLPDPVAVLSKHIAQLKKNGTVIISTPNFRHYSVLWQLFVRGHVRYTDAGILDRTHIRITTRKTVIDWCQKAGIEPLRCRYLLDRKRQLLSSLSFGLAAEFLAKQLIVAARKQNGSIV